MIDLTGLSLWAQALVTLILMLGVTTLMVLIVVIATLFWFPNGKHRR